MVALAFNKSGSFLLHLGFVVLGIVSFGIVSQFVECRSFAGDVFSSPEALLELYRSENIVMGELKKFLKENNVEHEYLER